MVSLKQLDNYDFHAELALQWLTAQIHDDGSYGRKINDLACYYKSPYLFSLTDHHHDAHKMLDFIKQKFMQDDGDFISLKGDKSENAAFNEFWSYTNGWITLAAQKLGRFDISYPAFEYLYSFYHPTLGAFTTHGPYGEKDNAVDLLTTAHFGHIALYFGDLEKAKKAGDFLCDTLSQQPDKEKIFLRFNNAGEIIQDFAHESDFLFVIDSKKPQRAYFMIGYPAAFLGLLYRATQSSKYLHAAKAYLDFALKCQPNLYHFHFSHKVAWAAAIVYSLTHDKPYLELSQKITNYLINTQNKDGTWLSDEPIFIKMDQTAETAIWLKEISNELRRILK